MPVRESERKSHLLVQNTATSERYTSVKKGNSKGNYLTRNRSQHGQKLQTDLRQVEQAVANFVNTPPSTGLEKENGFYVQFSSEPGYDLKVESLGNANKDIEPVAVQTIETEGELAQTTATVFIPEGQLSYFIDKVEKYLTEDTKGGNPQNKALVESVSQIKAAVLRDLWTDHTGFPEEDEEIWWEAWLRYGKNDDEQNDRIEQFQRQATTANLKVGEQVLGFPENTVLLLKGTAAQLSESVFLLDSLAEIRKAKETAEFFTNMTQVEQREWVQEAVDRIAPPDKDSLAICILDTGVNNGHPLIQPALSSEDMDSYNLSWGTNDTGTHGTEMAGLCLYGDLFDLLSSTNSIQLYHKLESIKILPPRGQNDPGLYGSITKECVSRAEIIAPDRKRILCMAVTATDFRDKGQPSSWSAALDAITFGEDEQKYLMFVSAGNIHNIDSLVDYPDINLVEGIHDPGQAWNIITVGAYTEKDFINNEIHPNKEPLAPKGGLCPSSTTSLIWQGKWPLKPDIVMEGGNMSTSPENNEPPDYSPDSLQLLSTNAQFQIGSPIAPTGDTSAATALASRYGAIIASEYPELWPETIRGLLVHSARWTDTMLDNKSLSSISKSEIKNMIRRFGYGVPDLEEALYSANNTLTLIAQESLIPYTKEGGTIKTNDLHLHELPWPQEVLSNLGELEIEMHITLSYFIEPNPGSRNNPKYRSKFQYASHGLRFEIKKPTDSIDEFRKRINKRAREENEKVESSASDSNDWVIGGNLRTSGSIHKDVWKGTAADLAEKGVVAIYPVKGWWCHRKQLEKWGESVRYSLIVSIKTEEQDVDIYTPVANIITV
ncbi:MAG: S8 family peptidase [Tunicatimonas sp.]|uniref:S8 family peptidase n=1 Tax=Tunicatimonas sp. TaxID=1940096 RepID=UPI003C76182B